MGELLKIVSDANLHNLLIRCFRKGFLEETKRNKRYLQNLFSQGFLKKRDNRYYLSSKGEVVGYNLVEWDLQVRRGEIGPLIDRMNIYSDSVIADVGCGGGQTLLACLKNRPAFICGFDKNSTALELAEAFHENAAAGTKFEFQEADALNLPLRDDFCTHIIFRGVLQKLNQRDAFIEINRILKKNGVFFLHTLGAGYYLSALLSPKKNIKSVFIISFALLNGIFFLLTGKQMQFKIRGKKISEIFLSVSTLKRSLRKIGWRIDSMEISRFLFMPSCINIIGKKTGLNQGGIK